MVTDSEVRVLVLVLVVIVLKKSLWLYHCYLRHGRRYAIRSVFKPLTLR